jgi:hypothetical protein
VIQPTDEFQHRSVRTSLYFSTSKLFIAGNRKAAGTAVRWWLLPAHGVDVEAVTRDVVGRELASTEAVWAGGAPLRYLWRCLSDEERKEALAAPDVLRIAFVRHPISRVFSTWSQKYLQREPGFNDGLPASFPQPPESVDSRDQIRDMFTEFVVSLSRWRGSWLKLDGHLYPQNLVLGHLLPDGATILPVEQMADAVTLIVDHLEQFGVSPGPLPRINEAIVGYDTRLVSAEAAAGLARLYRDDLETFSYAAEPPPSPAREINLEWLNDVRRRNERWAIARRELIALRRQLRSVRPGNRRVEVDALRRRCRELGLELDRMRASRSWRLTAPLRRVEDWVRASRQARVR